jgi:hypothetical protein
MRCRLGPPTVIGIWFLFTVSSALAQIPQLVFTVEVPQRTVSEAAVTSTVEERGLTLWTGAASDFGVGVAISRSAAVFLWVAVSRGRRWASAGVGWDALLEVSALPPAAGGRHFGVFGSVMWQP